MNILQQLAIVIFFLYMCSSCQQGINFDGDFRVSETRAYSEEVCSSIDYGVISERNEFISCSSPSFSRMVCLTEDKFKELVEILTRAEMPREKRKELIRELSRSIWWEDHDKVEL